MIFRNDDVNSNTNLEHLREIYAVIAEFFPNAEIWSSISLFSRQTNNGSIYEDVPFKLKPKEWFYRVNQFFEIKKLLPKSVITSHGLFHADHSFLQIDAQEMSILSSCSLLHTNIFVPPFNKYNSDTEGICKDNHIRLVKPDGWKNFEYEEFDPNHRCWYFHSWRFTPEKLRGVLDGNSV